MVDQPRSSFRLITGLGCKFGVYTHLEGTSLSKMIQAFRDSIDVIKAYEGETPITLVTVMQKPSLKILNFSASDAALKAAEPISELMVQKVVSRTWYFVNFSGPLGTFFQMLVEITLVAFHCKTLFLTLEEWEAIVSKCYPPVAADNE